MKDPQQYGSAANSGQRHFMEQAFGVLAALWSRPEAPPADAPGLCEALDLAHFLDEIPGGFLIYRAGGGEEILYANRGLLRIFGCESAEEFRSLTGNTFRGMVYAEDLAAAEESIARQVAASRYDLDYVEYRIRRRDGQLRWMEDHGHAAHSDALGSIFYVFLADATEKRMQQQLEQERSLQDLAEAYDRERALISQEHLRRLEVIEGLSVNYESIFYIDLARDSILPYRLSGRTQPAFEARFRARGYTGFVRDYIASWVYPEDREHLSRMIRPQAIRENLQKSGSYYVNYRVLAEGRIQYLQLRLAAAGQNSDGRQAVMGCRRVDDEVRREMEQKQALAEALNNANLAMTAKNTFLSNMSHDMRTPLNAILGFTALARHTDDPAARERYLDQVEASGKQLLAQINQVLELSQAQSGREQIDNIACDLIEIAQEACSFLQPQAAEKGIDFSLDCTGIKHSAVYADRAKLSQLILYLANNAVTYTNAGGVRIVLSEHDQLPNRYAVYRLVVADTGIGIDKDFAARIFDPFTRGKNTTLSGVHGIGLGLTIVKNIVELLDGSVSVQSEPGKGSTFTVNVRLCQNLPQEQPLHTGQELFAGPRCRRILLVEDNELNREIETELLQEAGFAIQTAEDGQAALDRVKAAAPGEFDLVLMDLQMPVMDGWASARAIRALEDPAKANLPIIALSANTMPEDLRRSREAGMDAHLPKPVDLTPLLETITEVIDRRGEPH